MFSKLFVSALLSFPVLAQVSQTSPATPLNQVAAVTTPVASPFVNPSVATPAVSTPAASQIGLKDPSRQERPGLNLYRWSVASVLAANAADVATSWSSSEANPVVAGGGGQFGATSIAIKSGLVGTSLLIQHFTLRHRPDLYRRMAWMNFITTGVLGGVAAHNASLR